MSTLLFGVITSPNSETITSQKPYIDGVEVRLDYFEHIDEEALKSFIKGYEKPVMLTVRRNDQGGRFSGTEMERLDRLEALCKLGPAYVDLEYDVPVEYRKRLFETYPNISFISSYHDFSNTPDDLEEVFRKVKTPNAHFYKIAVTANSCIDALKVLSFMKNHSQEKNFIGIAMGEEGQITRILAPVVGSYLTYAPLFAEDSTAPGQITAREMQELYRFGKLNRETEIYALIGDPVTKSLGAVIHNAVFTDADINAVYVKVRVTKEELQTFITKVVELPFKGFSVTMPLKESVLPMLSQTSIQTKVIGACNTIRVSNHQMTGYNTDGTGALDAIEKKALVFGRHVVIIGAGGSAKSIAFEATQRGAFVTLINRTPEKALEIADTLDCQGGGLELIKEVSEKGYDILVNCTPESDLIEEQWILPGKIVMDIVYIPKNTPFLVKALKKNCQIVYGYEMFVYQALEQQRIWFPETINADKVFEIILGSVLKRFRSLGCVKAPAARFPQVGPYFET